MRYTRSFARSRAAEEAQTLLLALTTAQLIPPPPPTPPPLPIYTVPNLETNVPKVLQNSSAISPHVPVETGPPPSRPIQRPAAPLVYPPHVPGLPKAGSKTRQSQYGTALQV